MNLPDGWEMHHLGELFSSRKEKGIEGLPTLSVTINNGLVDRSSIEKKTDTNLSPQEHLLIRKGDLAYNTMRMWQGAFGLADYDGLVSPAYVVLAPTDCIDSKFAYYWFKSPRMIYLFWAYSYGLTGDRLRLYFNDFTKIKNRLPQLLEQKTIAELLSTWDKAIEKTEKLIHAKEKQFKWMLNDLIYLPAANGKWKQIQAKSLFKERKEKNREDLPLLSITNAEGVIPRDETNRKDMSNNDKSKYLRICPGDIGYNTMRMWQGISALSTLEGIVSPAYTICIPGKELDPNFVAHLFKTPFMIHRFYRYSQGLTSDTWNLKYPYFCEIKIPLPPLEEQKQIAEILCPAKQEIDLLKQLAEKYKTQKRGLMQKMLTGEWRVKDEIINKYRRRNHDQRKNSSKRD